MKGQMFIIAALIIIVSIVILKSMMSFYEVTGEKEFLETNTLDREMRNIEAEYSYLTGITTMNSQSDGVAYFSNFSGYLYDEDARIIYLYIFVNGTTQDFSVTTGNYAGNRINAAITIQNSLPVSDTFTLNDRSYHTTNFVSTANNTRNVIFTYTLEGETVKEKIPIAVDGKNFVSGFFDITLENNEMKIRRKIISNRTW